MTLPIKAELLVELGNWQRGLTKASKQISGFGKSVKTISNGIKGAVAGVGLAFATGFLSDFIKAAEQARQADQRLDKVASTIDIFGSKLPSVTKRLKEFADQQEISTGVTAEEIKAAQTKILTYTAVAKSADEVGGIFDRTTKAALDLAATGFGTVEGNADTLGKALANPLKGLASLQKQGFVYTEAQKKQFAVWIKQGKLYKAQEFILKDIESQVQGVAEASGSSMQKFSNAIGQVTDSIGEQFLPILDQMVEWFQSDEGKQAIKSVTDEIQKLGEWFVSPEGKDAMKSWMDDLQTLIKLAGDFLGLVGNIVSTFDDNKKSESLTTALNTKEGKNAFNYLGGGQATGKFAYTSAESLQKSSSTGNMSTVGAVTNNITINGGFTGQSVMDALKKTANTRGVPLGQLLR